MEDGSLATIVGSVETELQPGLNDDYEINSSEQQIDMAAQLNAILHKLERIDKKVNGVDSKVNGFVANMDKCLNFMLNVEKLMSDRNTACSKMDSEDIQEDFSEFQHFSPAESKEELISLESLLADSHYMGKLSRYVKTIKFLDGKRNGDVIFRDLIRLFVQPNALIDYSWKGQSRQKTGKTLISFKASFPKFIELMNGLVCAADKDFVLEKTQVAFDKFLRQKNTELKRNAERTAERRAGSTRSRTKRTRDTGSGVTETDATSTNTDPVSIENEASHQNENETS